MSSRIGSSKILSFLISSASSLDVVCNCLPSFVVNSMASIIILLFGCSDVVGRSSTCLSAVVRCCFPVLPSAMMSSLSLAGDVGGGAGSGGRFWCAGDVAIGDVGSAVLFCFVASVALCLLPSADVLVVASFCNGGALSMVLRELVCAVLMLVSSMGLCVHSPAVADCTCEA